MSKKLLFNNAKNDDGGSGGDEGLGVYVEVPVVGDTAGNFVEPYVLPVTGAITDGVYAWLECTFSGTSTYGIYVTIDDVTESSFIFTQGSLNVNSTYYFEVYGLSGEMRCRLRGDSETGSIIKTSSSKFTGFSKMSMNKIQRIKSLKIKRMK